MRACATCGGSLSGSSAPFPRCVDCGHWEDECSCPAAGLRGADAAEDDYIKWAGRTADNVHQWEVRGSLEHLREMQASLDGLIRDSEAAR